MLYGRHVARCSIITPIGSEVREPMTTRRKLIGLIGGSAAALALGEMRAGATGYSKPRTCSSAHRCPRGCSCKSGTCQGTTDKTACIAAQYNYWIAYYCPTPLFRDCEKIKHAGHRRTCQNDRRNDVNKHDACLRNSHTNVANYALAVCS
jgi:hypothetical protein